MRDINNYIRSYAKGKSFEFTEWSKLNNYTNSGIKQDFVTYKGSLYACICDVAAGNESPDKDTIHWKLAAGFFIEREDLIKLLGFKPVNPDISNNFSKEQTFSEGINLNNTYIKGVADPEENNDAATKKYVDNQISPLNTKIGNENFGGVICLNLGNSMESNIFTKIVEVLQSIVQNQKHYLITVYDTVSKEYYGDCEVIYESDGIIRIINNKISSTLTAYDIIYTFDTIKNTYSRNLYSIKIASTDSVDAVASVKQDKLTAGKGITIDENNNISINFDPDIFKVVTELPVSPAEGDERKVHLVPSNDTESKNVYDEYVYINSSWEKIGSFRPTIDLSDYAKTADIPVEKGEGENSVKQKSGNNIANGELSFVEGSNTIASNDSEHAEGKYNKSIKDKTIHTVGIGDADDRKNAHEIHTDGSHYIYSIGGYDGTNSQTEGIKTLQEVVNNKQDKLISGDGIKIDGNIISTDVDHSSYATKEELNAEAQLRENNDVAISPSEPEAKNPIWVDTDDSDEEVIYNKEQVDKIAESKQDALTLTVKDNGNIILSSIQGQSKEFMPATPSGDPMHYAYVAAGAEYNDTGADIVKNTPWADLADDDADKTVVHKNGYWYLNGLGDITNEQMRKIYAVGNIYGYSTLESALRYFTGVNFVKIRTNICNGGWGISTRFFSYYKTNIERLVEVCYQNPVIECLVLTPLYHVGNNITITADFQNAFYLSNIKIIIGLIDMSKSRFNLDAFKCHYLKVIKITKLNKSIDFSSSSVFTIKSVLYMINNEVAASPITITLHADVYNKCMANADILAALEAHTNISLASA